MTGPVSRRRFLRGSTAGLGALALGDVGIARAATLRLGTGAFGDDGRNALIWIGDDVARRVRVDFGSDPALARPRAGPTVTLNRRTGFTTAVSLPGLTPGEIYYYRLVDADSGAPVSGVGRFKTAPALPRPFTFAFSSCMHERHAPFRLFDVIAARRPDFFLHLGDTVYADQPREQFAPILEHYRRKHAAIRRDPHLQRFLAGHLTYAIWDDHEIADGAHGGQDGIEDAMQAIRESWPCASVRRNGLHRRFTWAGADFFILDVRSYRSPREAPDGPAKTMLGAEQKQWFLDGLKGSRAPFKFVVTPVPFHGDGADSWGGYAGERDEIVREIRRQAIRGVVFLSGDYHMARDCTSGATGLREYMAGPIAQYALYQESPAERARYQRAGAFHFGDGYNFGFVRVDPAARSATVEFIDAMGRVLYAAEFSP